MLKPERDAIADTKAMQYEDFELLAGIGQPDSEYPLGIGGTMDDAPTMGMYATQPETPRGSREPHMYDFKIIPIQAFHSDGQQH
jgi:hypothetical protein